MDFLRPTSWADALAAKAEHPDALAITGGTDVMVELNFDQRRPATMLDLGGVRELANWDTHDGRVRLGAAVPYSRVITELGDRLPGLSIASRTVGSPQIRNRGTVGGNLGSASPAGDAHPPLLACGADVEVCSVRGSRLVPITEFFTGVKRSVLEPDELVAGVHVEDASGPQQFSKVGTRNAMVIAVCTFAVALHPQDRTVGTGLGSAAPTPRRATEAEQYLADELADTGRWETPTALPDSVTDEFGDLVTAAAAPIDDVRGSADYRKHAIRVLARRTLGWAWNDYCAGRQQCA